MKALPAHFGIYGDFLYGASHTRYGSGIIESISGITLGSLLELGLVQPLSAIAKALEGKDSHLLAQTVGDLKGFFPGVNIWYTKAAFDHLIVQQIMELVSPGYLGICGRCDRGRRRSMGRTGGGSRGSWRRSEGRIWERRGDRSSLRSSTVAYVANPSCCAAYTSTVWATEEGISR